MHYIAGDLPNRSVADNQRTLSLGIQSTILRMIGSIPSPMVFGAVFDSACQHWQHECGRRGNCWVYDNEKLAMRAFVFSLSGLVISLIFFVLSWLLYRKDSKEKADDEGKGSTELKEVNSCDRSWENGETDKLLVDSSVSTPLGTDCLYPTDSINKQTDHLHSSDQDQSRE